MYLFVFGVLSKAKFICLKTPCNRTCGESLT